MIVSNVDQCAEGIYILAVLLDMSKLLVVFGRHEDGHDGCFKWNINSPGVSLVGGWFSI
jgi:hypothetical protein